MVQHQDLSYIAHSAFIVKTGLQEEFNVVEVMSLSYSIWNVGVCYEGCKTFLALMNLPTPDNKSANDKLIKKLQYASKTVAEELMDNAAEEIRNNSNKHTETVETAISCDGTWPKRGFTSLNGAVAGMSIKPGFGC